MTGARALAGIAAGATVIALLGVSVTRGRADDATDPFAELLGTAERTPEDAQLPAGRWREGGPHRLASFEALWDDWRGIDAWSLERGRTLLAASASLPELIDEAARPLGVTREAAPRAPGAPEGPPREALVAAIAAVHASGGAPLDDEARARLVVAVASIPEPMAAAAATILSAVPAAVIARSEAFGELPAEPDAAEALFHAAIGVTGYRIDERSKGLLERLDLDALLGTAGDLAAAVEAARVALAPVEPAAVTADLAFRWKTPLGEIAISGSGKDAYAIQPWLLIIDAGGDDAYQSAATTETVDTPVSISIDLAGDDRYEVAEGGAFGVAVLGWAILIDRAGDDHYRAVDHGIAAANFGVALLVDEAGADRYEGRKFTQGAASAGVAILADLGPEDDEYRCLQKAQGYGQVRGAGVLLDAGGGDLYDANDTEITSPSPQTAEHNVSLAQGAGYGRRSDADRGWLAGGVGLLVDGGGDDRYSCGVFGQGVGYWYALGALVDLGGDDRYRGVWYAQGASAHYAIGALVDLAGDDRYKGELTMAIGAGHDFGHGVLRDHAGNDHYECPANTVGSAVYNGIGIFRDDAGDDTYVTGRNAIGHAGHGRAEHPCFALFLDLGGTDTYPGGHPAEEGTSWRHPAPAKAPKSLGLGADR